MYSKQQRQKTGARRSIQVIRAAAVTDVASATQQAITKTIGGDVFVAGGTGQLSARVIQELLRNGFKVTAGVQDAAEAQAGLDFAKRFEILKGDELKRIRLQEVDLTDESSIAAALPRNARVLVAVGDSVGNQKADPQLLSRALSAAVSRDAQQFILVTPLGGGGGTGGFLAGLFGGGASSSKQPSKTERQVAESGLNFVIVRAAKSDGVDPSLLESGVTVTPQGSLTNSSQVAKSQVAEVVAQVLLQSQTDVLIEVAADPDSPPSSVEAAVAQVLPQCNISEEQQEEEDEEEEEQEPPPKARGGLSGGTKQIKAQGEEQSAPQQNGGAFGGLFGGRSKASPDGGPQAQKKIDTNLVDAQPAGKQRGGFAQITGKAKQQVEDVAEDADKAASKSPFGGLFGGTKKIKQQAKATVQDAEESLEKESSKSSSPLGSLFGGAKKAKKETEQVLDEEKSKPQSPVRGLFGGAKKAKQEVEEVVDEESSKPSSPLGGLFGGAKKAKQQAQAAAQEIAEDEESSPKNPLTGFFGGAKKVKAEAQQKTPSVGGARKSAAQGISAKGKQGKSAMQRAGSAAANGAADGAPKKKGGFLQALGIGQDSMYAENDK